MTRNEEARKLQIEAIIGARIAQLREEHGWTQSELGRQLGEVLDKSWSRQAVWTAEQGKRVFTARELVALAYVFDTTVENLMKPSSEIEQIELPRVSIEWADLIAPSLPDTKAGATLREIHTGIADVRQVLTDLNAAVDGLSVDVEKAVREARIK